ncbi:MAG: hypothetical protein LC708_01325, partial [Actinobacteria bacterium]|nr:hypothetical protein [Actinomycetota bacterium]
MVSVRTPLASDAVRAGVADDGSALDTRTVIAYDTDGTNPAVSAKVSSVKLPRAKPVLEDPLATRITHNYTYGPPAEVRIPGFAPSSDVARTVNGASWNAPANPVDRRFTVTETAPAATTNPATSVFDAGRAPLSAADSAGRATATVRDGDADRGAHPTGRVTDTYGPGPTSCFASTPPTCAELPRTSTVYDAVPDPAAPEGLKTLNGLAVAWWDNITLGGGRADLGAVPRGHSDNVEPGPSGSLVAPPPPDVGATWSARYSGEMDLGAAGDHGFALSANGKARLYVDDRLVVDAWEPHTNPVTGTLTGAGAGRHRIRVDYVPQGTALLS